MADETNPLEHTERIEKMLQYGAREEAAIVHNAHLDDQFERAKRGEIICLTDLMAAKETLVMDEIARRRKGGRR